MKGNHSKADQAILKFREKRKWQIALRRYVLERQLCVLYAPFFGIDILGFRKWIELQFDGNMSWDNFGKMWQFDHIIPVVYFDHENDHDLKLCWNFTNIRAEKSNLNKFRGNRVDVLTAKAYFEDLFNSTGYFLCNEMIRKIERIEIAQIGSNNRIEQFIIENFAHLSDIQHFNEYEFMKLNSNVSVNDIKEERKLLAKFE